MRYLSFGPDKSKYKICILVPTIEKDAIEQELLTPFGINPDDVLVLDLHQSRGKKKTPMAEMKEYIQQDLVPILEDMGIEYLVIGDADYFKAFTKSAQADRMSGYVVNSIFGNWNCVYVPNYKAIFYDPDKIRSKINMGMSALVAHANGSYNDPGFNIAKRVEYPQTIEDIQWWLDELLRIDVDLSCDLEGFSLKHYEAGIGTVTLCWNQEEGVAFPVDYNPYGPDFALEVRDAFKAFLIKFKRKMIYHNIAYDAMVLIYQLFMDHILDTKGMLEGMEIILKNWDDTKLISYLATNSCAGNKLSLKDQAQEYAGNYAVDEITDITKIPLDQLLQYNLVDGLSTWFVYNKHRQTVINDNQEKIYQEIFKPAIVDIIQMQLTGLPISMPKVLEAEVALQADYDAAMVAILSTPIIAKFNTHLKQKWAIEKNQKLKKKRVTPADAPPEIVFNPNSGPQLIDLLYENFLNLPVLDLTDSRQPATGGDTLKKLIHRTEDPDIKTLIQGLIDFKAVDKILTSFIPAFKKAVRGPDGWWYLFGNFNLGGTVSGRLSSSDPNLQNLPATGSRYAKLIKECFCAPTGWLFVGVDFASLEDRISALTTKDPNKLKVYTDNYDGHCLRAYAYFTELMPDIDPNSVDSINSIAVKYKDLRQKSKNPTFALTYQGTYKTLMTNYNFTEELSRRLETSYAALYAVSINYVNQKLEQATKDGYVTVAFGLRVRTPLLAQSILGTKKTPSAVAAEGRTAGNALGQSWCLLNNRAGSEFMGRVRSEKYRYDIRPCAQIHDAQYFMVRDDINVIKYVNKHLIDAVKWQNDPEIWHNDVKLGGELSIFYPNWAKECVIPNDATEDMIMEAVAKHAKKLEKA